MHIIQPDGSRQPVSPVQQTHFTQQSPPEAQWTLRQWWEWIVQPELARAGRAKDTLGQYETYLRRWDECFARLEHWTCTPVLQQISPTTLGEYRAYLLTVTSEHAADKHVRGISVLLRRAEKAWILPRVAQLQPLRQKVQVATKWTFYPDDVSAIYQAAEHAAWPRSPIAPLAWRAFLVGGWNYGFRTQEWWAWRKEMTTSDSGGNLRSLRWGGVCWEPEIEIEARVFSNSNGWISWTQQKTGHVCVLPMNQAVRHHLSALYEATPADQRSPQDRVFNFPFSAGTSKGRQQTHPHSGFYSAWWDLVSRARLEPRVDAKGKKITHSPCHLRKTAHTLHKQQIGDAANWITGHSGRSVGERHYYLAVDDVIRSIGQLKQPDGFVVG